MIPLNRCPDRTRSAAISWPRSSARHQPPRRRDVVRRHIIEEVAAARGCAVDAFGDAERDFTAEYGSAAVPGDAERPFDRHPGWLARAAAQRAWRRIVGEIDLGAAVAGALAIMADEVAGARALAIAPGHQPAKRARAAVGVEQRLSRFGAEIDLHVLVGEPPLAGEGESGLASVLVAIDEIVGTMRRGGDPGALAVRHHEAAGAAFAVAVDIAGDIAAAGD